MEICRVPRQLPPINLRFEQTLAFHPVRVRCNLLQDAKTSAELCSGGRMFILGMGFVGQFFAADCKAKGWVVSGSCTSIAKKKKLEELGYQTYVFDANDPQLEILEILKNHTHLVVSIPPLGGLGDPMLRHKRLVESILKGGKLRWLVYLSTTSVYGDCGGAWVDEDYPVKPASELARARLAAEEEWLCLGHNLGIEAQVFRLGGIYGPGRRKIYNIVDDDPAPRTEVFELAQKLIEGKFPGSHGKQYKSPERAESLVTEKAPRGEKRVSNSRMKKELSVKLIHPTYRSGLRSIIDNMDSSLMQESPGS
ncbi:UNVERIFIED_CONTAM: hypothetical protein Sradi_0991100 [Sesamum radiatum]|uniref:NAD-dependent epimerase/dehydratase domain-containing protein n=1 Tax=Sesamum radiatum TaxID=300843 RepID=A0AAW2V6J6_SESRA